MVEAVPPHWKDNIVEQHGSRWAGQAITTDSRVVDNAPPRIVGSGIHRELEHIEDMYTDFPDEEDPAVEQRFVPPVEREEEEDLDRGVLLEEL